MEAKRKWPRRLSAGLAIACALFVGSIGSIMGLRLYYNDTRLTALIRHLLADNVPFPVTIGAVHFSVRSGVELSQLRVGPPNARYKDDVLTIERVALHYRLAPLLHRRLDIRAVTAARPHITLEMQNGVWNVAALANAFPPTQAPPVKAAGESDLPVSIALEAFDVNDASADVHAPNMSAHLGGLSLAAHGMLAGKGGSGGAEIRSDGVFAFAQQGLGEITGHLAARFEAAAASFTEAALNWSLVVTDAHGAVAGVALPAWPLTLRGQAHANLLAQTIAHSEVAWGEALQVEVQASATDLLGDPLLDVTALKVRAALAPLVALAPKDIGRVNGQVEVDASVSGRLSALQAQRDFAADTTVRWHELTAQQALVTLAPTDGTLTVHVPRGAPLTVALQSHSAAATSAAGRASDITVHMDVAVPLSVLAQKLDTSATAVLRVQVGDADAQGQHVHGIDLTARGELFDLAAAHAKASLVLDVAEARVQAAGRTLSVPVHVDAAAERTGATVRIAHALVALGSLLSLSAEGTALGRRVDMRAALSEVDLAALLAAVPANDRPHGLALSGKLAAEVAVKGALPVSLDSDPLALLSAVTPFALSLHAAWHDVAFAQTGSSAMGIAGSLQAQTAPHTAAVRLSGDVAHAETAGSLLDHLHYGLTLDDHAGDVTLALQSAIAKLHRPDTLAQPLANVTLDTTATFGRDAVLKNFTLSVPTLGARLSAQGHLLRADTFVREQQWRDLGAVHAAFGFRFDLAPLGSLMPLARQSLALSGALGVAANALVEGGVAKLTGAFSAQKFSASDGDAQLTQMSGTLPFSQSVRLGAAPRPLWSESDIFKQKPRLVYYDELRAYGRDAAGLTIAQLKQGRFAIDRVALNGHFADGMLLIDHFGASLLAGDVAGQLALQLGADKTLRLALATTFSNIDFSVLSKTKPGPDSQINGNASLQLSWGERVHNVDGTFNLTRLGRELLVKALLALDPEDKDAKLRANRQAMQRYQITIDLLEAWIKNNNLNANLFYSLILTKLTLGLYKPINNDLVRRNNLAPRLDAAAPNIDPILGPLLGWSQAQPGATP